MMRKILFLPILLFFATATIAQKKPLDYSALENWPTLKAELISNDGKFVAYNISTEKTGNTLFVQAVGSFWKQEIKKGKKPVFTQDSKLMIYSQSSDSIGVMELATDKVTFIGDIVSYKCLHTSTNDWLVYRLKTSNNDLTIRELSSGKETRYSNVKDFGFSETNGIIYFQFSDNPSNNSNEKGIALLNLPLRKFKKISTSINADRFLFDLAGKQIIFQVQEKSGNNIRRILWYYKDGMDTAQVLVDQHTPGMDGMAIFNYDQPYFGMKADKVFFSVSTLNLGMETDKPNKDSPSVEVWNYKHTEYQSNPTTEAPKISQSFLSVINLNSEKGRVLRLEKPGDTIVINFDRNYINNGDFVLVKSEEVNANDNSLQGLYLISTNNASKQFLKNFHNYDYKYLSVSPDNKYIVWFNVETECWTSYDVTKKVKREVSKSVPQNSLIDYSQRWVVPFDKVAGWLKGEAKIYFYDQFDVWSVDLNGKNPPKNITNGFGKKNGLQLRLANLYGDYKPLILNKNEPLLLTAFDPVTKNSGFYKKMPESNGDPQILTFGPYAYYFYPKISGLGAERYASIPLKAQNASTYITYRMNANTYPNLLVTQDFKDFSPLTSLNPSGNYNWYTNELIHWKMLDGNVGEGMLFKPNDFDSKKKYPVIFYIYEVNSPDLNLFINPALSNGIINIPWYVNHGYVVCVPDIKIKIGYPGASAYNAVVSAAQYLIQMPWVNEKKLGLQGHSHGGFETNYIVSHSSLFAAAAPGASSSDLISKYNSLIARGESNHEYYENGQGNIGSALWKKPELYFENSPILKADKVTTPLFIMHNRGDELVLWPQGLGWYVALQSLGKKVWMVQYDGEAHTIRETKNQLDYSIRLNQFFDHYLKDKPAPKWMTQGIPSWRRGIDMGYELDPQVEP